MDCYEWRNCEGDCENCEVANMDIAQAVQHWPDADFMTHNYSPEEVLGLLRQLGERAERAERERDELLEVLQMVADEWDRRGKQLYRSGAPACIFKVKEKLDRAYSEQ